MRLRIVRVGLQRIRELNLRRSQVALLHPNLAERERKLDARTVAAQPFLQDELCQLRSIGAAIRGGDVEEHVEVLLVLQQNLATVTDDLLVPTLFYQDIEAYGANPRRGLSPADLRVDATLRTRRITRAKRVANDRDERRRHQRVGVQRILEVREGLRDLALPVGNHAKVIGRVCPELGVVDEPLELRASRLKVARHRLLQRTIDIASGERRRRSQRIGLDVRAERVAAERIWLEELGLDFGFDRRLHDRLFLDRLRAADEQRHG